MTRGRQPAAPTVSVVMPVYNHERFVGEAIESVLSQTLPALELILVNDGSVDGSEAVIRAFDDPRIRYFAQENRGAHEAINRGLSLARGEYVSILNSDDRYRAERLAVLAEQARARRARFCFTAIAPVDERSLPLDPTHPWCVWYRGLLGAYDSSRSLTLTLLKGNVTATTSNFFFSRDLLRQVGPFTPHRYAHDYSFALRAVFGAHAPCLFLSDRTLLDYRVHGGNTIRENAVRLIDEVAEILLGLDDRDLGPEERRERDAVVADLRLQRLAALAAAPGRSWADAVLGALPAGVRGLIGRRGGKR